MTHSFVVRLPLAIVYLDRFATLREGAKDSIQLPDKSQFIQPAQQKGTSFEVPFEH